MHHNQRKKRTDKKEKSYTIKQTKIHMYNVPKHAQSKESKEHNFLYLLVDGAEYFPQLSQSLLVPYIDTVPYKVLWTPREGEGIKKVTRK